MRIDKFLADMNFGTRSQVKDLIKKKLVKVNGEIVRSSSLSVSEKDTVEVNGQTVSYVELEYYLLNKPAGYLSATEDRYDHVVMELVNSQRKDLYPVGRLDKDTEGLLIICNDGDLTHRLLSPKYHVNKKYYAELDKPLPDNAKELLEAPMDLGDFITKGSSFEKINDTSAYLTISEGKFHQVRRMFEKTGCTVTYLKRVSFAFLTLEGLETGQYRKLSEEEIEKLKSL